MIYKFILLLRKSAHPYDQIDKQEKFNEISLPEKEDFYSHLNIKYITDAEYNHPERICKDF